MKRILIALLFVAAVYTPASAGSIPREYPGWKTPQHFEISSVYDYQEEYDAAQPIAFYVEGKSDKIDLGQSTGFTIQARIDEFPRTKPLSFANGKYDPEKRAWQLTFTAPKDNTKKYEIHILLYCGRDNSPCSDTYGRAAQVEKILPLTVR